MTDFSGKLVAIVGFGKEGRSVARYLEATAPTAQITVLDREPIKDCPYPVRTGTDYLKDLTAFDVIVKSPGIAPYPEFDVVSDRMTSSTRIFWELAANAPATIVGITGTKGKSTTSALLAHILTVAGRRALLVGNVGEPVLDHVDELQSPDAIFIQEVSSYQLNDVSWSPSRAVFTAFFPEHLDYHGTLPAYRKAKENLVRFQKVDGKIFFPAGDQVVAVMAAESPGLKVPVMAQLPVALNETKLSGSHNLQNAALAVAVAQDLGVSEDACKQALRSFEPLPHRLQRVSDKNGIVWVDDSISTTPESAVAGLEALDRQVATLIAGGMDRGYDYHVLAKAVYAYGVKTVVLLPESGNRIAEAIAAYAPEFPLHEVVTVSVGTMEAAVSEAFARTPVGTTCLLSPAAPSYNMFKNFEERGDAFRAAVDSFS